jgi:dipeptidyl aminopeptidase/acylaminoacyl peptidase
MKNFVISLLLASSTAGAVCNSRPPVTLLRTYKTKFGLNYFIRSSTVTREIGFSTDEGNKILNLTTGKVASVSGSLDPVLSPDGRVLAVPERLIFKGVNPKALPVTSALQENDVAAYEYNADSGKVRRRIGKSFDFEQSPMTFSELKSKNIQYVVSGMSFYIRNTNGRFVFSHVDLKVNKYYQSIGRGQKADTFRLLYEGDNSVMLKEYAIDHTTGELRDYSQSRALCGTTTGINSSIPMISKDGSKFSIYDPGAGITKIINISDCRVVATLPFQTGKIDFSPDGKHIIFHVDLNRKGGEQPYRIPADKSRLAIRILNLETKLLSEIYAGRRADEDLYYPTFISDSQIAFVSRQKNHGNLVIQTATVNEEVSAGCSSPAVGHSSNKATSVR